jgi:hypothetical protein
MKSNKIRTLSGNFRIFLFVKIKWSCHSAVNGRAYLEYFCDTVIYGAVMSVKDPFCTSGRLLIGV